jgi:hypothetical protein
MKTLKFLCGAQKGLLNFLPKNEYGSPVEGSLSIFSKVVSSKFEQLYQRFLEATEGDSLKVLQQFLHFEK